MIYLLSSAAFVLFIILAFFSFVALFDGDFKSKVLAVIFWIVSLAVFFYLVDESNNKGPCVKYETQMHYNSAVKTMMPARACVQRGEWVE